MSFLQKEQLGISTNLFHGIQFQNIFEAVFQLSQSFSTIEVELEYGFKTLLDIVSIEVSQSERAQAWNVIKRLQELQSEKSLHISVHAPYIGADCDLSAEDTFIREQSCQLLQKSIDFCVELGAERLVYHPGYRSEQPPEKALNNLKRSLDTLIPVATKKGVKLCMENTGNDRPAFLLFSPAQYIELARQTGTFLALDLVHHASLFATKECTLDDIFFQTAAEMLPYVMNIHIADMLIPKHVHLPIGEGNLPISRLLNFLGKQRYAGNVIIEEVGGGFSSQQFIAAAANFRESYFDELLVATCV